MNGVGVVVMIYRMYGLSAFLEKQEMKYSGVVYCCYDIFFDFIIQEGLRDKCDNLIWGLKVGDLFV